MSTKSRRNSTLSRQRRPPVKARNAKRGQRRATGITTVLKKQTRRGLSAAGEGLKVVAHVAGNAITAVAEGAAHVASSAAHGAASVVEGVRGRI
jgi:hypothetical protein